MKLVTDCKFCTSMGECVHPHIGYALCHSKDACKGYQRKEKTMKKFWMLLVDGTTYPTRQHHSINDAITEATRLLNLKENWGKGVTLLEAVDRGRLGALSTPAIYPVIWELGRDHVYEFPEDFGE